MALIYEDRTKILKGMFYEVQNEVGLGRHEEAYHRACVLWLQSNDIPFLSKPPHRLMLGSDEAYVLHPDLVLWDGITVELKAFPRRLGNGEVVQLFDYLKCRGDRLGLLVNMGSDRVEDQRFVYDAPQTQMIEDWTYWSGAIGDSDREIGMAVRKQLRLLYDTHGTGFGDEVFQRLILCAVTRLGFSVLVRPVSKAYFRGVEVHESALDCLVVEDRLVSSHVPALHLVDFFKGGV